MPRDVMLATTGHDGGMHYVPPGRPLRTGYIVEDVPETVGIDEVLARANRVATLPVVGGVVSLKWAQIATAEQGDIAHGERIA